MNNSVGCQQAVTWLVMGAYAVLASGLPLPLGVESTASLPAAKRLAGKDRSTPFPCMDKPCGCATAEQCFTNCCCHTPAETLVWARARGVEPAVIAALQRRVAAPPPPAEPSCCTVPSRDAVPSCCSVKKSCCEAETATPLVNDPHDSPDSPAEPASERTLSLRAMLACGGIVAEWFSCGVSLPPARVVVAIGLACIECLPLVDESASPVRDAPDAPPPRVG